MLITKERCDSLPEAFNTHNLNHTLLFTPPHRNVRMTKNGINDAIKHKCSQTLGVMNYL